MWEPDELQDLKYMLGQNFRPKEIAEVLGKTYYQVLYRIRVSGLEISPREKDGLYLCGLCRKYKEKEEFHKRNDRGDGVNYACKECTSIVKKEQYHKEKIKKLAEANIEVKTKEEINGSKVRVCTKCGVEKDVEQFAWQKKYQKVKSRCVVCQREDFKNYKLDRAEKKGY